MSKWSIQSPIRRNPSTAELIGGFVINLFIGITTTALGIHMYNENKARKESEGKQ